MKDLLLPLNGDAIRGTIDAIDRGVAMAEGLGARVAALALEAA